MLFKTKPSEPLGNQLLQISSFLHIPENIKVYKSIFITTTTTPTHTMKGPEGTIFLLISHYSSAAKLL